MPRKNHSEEQIVRVLRQAEAGKKVSEICRKLKSLVADLNTGQAHTAGGALKKDL